MFRKWTAIAAVAGALERRVFASTSMSRVYANLYVLLVAPPGVGKSVAIKEGATLMRKTRKLKMSPDDMTKAALLDAMAACGQTHIYSAAEMMQYHSLQLTIDEFGTLVPSHDLSFMSVMNKLYDNADEYKETRRGREEDLVIENPQINMIAGTQPDFLASLLPPEAWGMGFMSRIVMVYQGKSAKPKLFGQKLRIDTKDLLEDLKVVCELHGEMDFTEKASASLVSWYESGMEPIPEHSKLKHYVPRRILTTIKLAMVSCAARSNEMMIDEHDINRAREWLIEAEALMPDIFKDMSGPGDGEIIKDLHYYIWEQYAKLGNKGVHRARIDTFLMARTPAYNAENIVKLCIRAKILIEISPDLFKPGDQNTLRSE